VNVNGVEIEINKNLMILLLAYLYVHYVIFWSMVMHMHIKLMNTFGNWLICLGWAMQQTITLTLSAASHSNWQNTSYG